MCEKNFFKDPTSGECTSCMVGAVCNFTEDANLRLYRQEGYWRGVNRPYTMTPCRHSFACPKWDIDLYWRCTYNRTDDINTTAACQPDLLAAWNPTCADGYTGPVCMSCMDGYAPDSTTKCHKCDSDEMMLVYAMLAFVAGLVVFGGTVYYADKLGARKANERRSENTKANLIDLTESGELVNANRSPRSDQRNDNNLRESTLDLGMSIYSNYVHI
jgi:hypothetical protein